MYALVIWSFHILHACITITSVLELYLQESDARRVRLWQQLFNQIANQENTFCVDLITKRYTQRDYLQAYKRDERESGSQAPPPPLLSDPLITELNVVYTLMLLALHVRHRALQRTCEIDVE